MNVGQNDLKFDAVEFLYILNQIGQTTVVDISLINLYHRDLVLVQLKSLIRAASLWCFIQQSRLQDMPLPQDIQINEARESVKENLSKFLTCMDSFLKQPELTQQISKLAQQTDSSTSDSKEIKKKVNETKKKEKMENKKREQEEKKGQEENG